MSNLSALFKATATEGVIHPLEFEAFVALIVQQLVVVVVLLLGRFRYLAHQIGRRRLFNLGINKDMRLVLRQVARCWLGRLGIRHCEVCHLQLGHIHAISVVCTVLCADIRMGAPPTLHTHAIHFVMHSVGA